MEIRIDPHALERAEERGTNEEEIKDVISTGLPIPAKHGRMGKAKVYDFVTPHSRGCRDMAREEGKRDVTQSRKGAERKRRSASSWRAVAWASCP
jgi:hypothetical protein